VTNQEPWELVGFPERVRRWIEQCNPSIRLRDTVDAWIDTRYDNPREGVQQESDFPNLWCGEVPNTLVRDTVVLCSYFIEEETHTVRCHLKMTVGHPSGYSRILFS